MNEIRIQMHDDGVAKVAFDDPGRTVNVMTPYFPGRVRAELGPLVDDPAMKAVALASGKPDTFITGADIKLFFRVEDPDVVTQIDLGCSNSVTRLIRGVNPWWPRCMARLSAAYDYPYLYSFDLCRLGRVCPGKQRPLGRTLSASFSC
ncbi:MAG: hypothetical protein GY859_25325 [Desulfobacterales bacterium]|nr:hypothetical protein [Desulfobacterales bacterium]